LPPVSTTLLKLVEKFDAGVVDTGGAPWLPNISVNFRKIWNALNGILWAGGKLIHEKNQEQKISWHYPFKVDSWKQTHEKNSHCFVILLHIISFCQISSFHYLSIFIC
jgi:hypothetical protein